MSFLYYISDCMIPFVILYLVGYGMCKKVNIFDEFIEGAKDGFLTVYKIMPTLIGLMVGVCRPVIAPCRISAFSGGIVLPLYCKNVFLFSGHRIASGCI